MSSLDWDSTKRKLAEAAAVGRDAGVTKSLQAGGRTALDATAERTAQVMAAAQALLASDLSSDLNNLVAAAVKGSATIYDKAMDANYLDPLLRPGLGGSYHRLFDGGHTIAGAVRAARDASPDDTIVEEALGTVQALLRDAATPRGLPLATWDKSTFDAVAGSLESTFAIPKRWFYDLNTYDAAIVAGAALGPAARTAIATPVASTLPKSGSPPSSACLARGRNRLHSRQLQSIFHIITSNCMRRLSHA